ADGWSDTNVSPITKVPFELAPDEESPEQRSHPSPLAWGEGVQLVFINGRYSRALSSSGSRPAGRVVARRKDALAQDPDPTEPYLAKSTRDGNAFAAVNAAFLEDGAWVRIPTRTAVT